MKSVLAALLLPSLAYAGPKVANTDPKPAEQCVAWVDDKCVARGTPTDLEDDDAKPAPTTTV